MMASKSNGAYNMLISLRDKLTRLHGVITPEAIDKLKDELGGIFRVTSYRRSAQLLAPPRPADSYYDDARALVL